MNLLQCTITECVVCVLEMIYITAKPVGITLICTGAKTEACWPLLIIAMITLNSYSPGDKADIVDNSMLELITLVSNLLF